MKIITRIKGGLGNQLFCYAAARRLSIFNDAELVIDNTTGFLRDRLYNREYRLNNFNIASRIATSQEMLMPYSRYRRCITKFINKFRIFENRSYIEELSTEFDFRLINKKLNKTTIYVDGLWQSVKYFSDIEEVLKNDLIFTMIQSKQNKSAARLIQQQNATAIHVRYFGAHNDIHNVPIQYYRFAIAAHEKNFPNSFYVIFSDNPTLALSELNIPMANSLCVDWNVDKCGEVSDLWLMTHCTHYIIANSTFSWWGAWLGAQPKISSVYFPRSINKFKRNWAWDFGGQMLNWWTPIEI